MVGWISCSILCHSVKEHKVSSPSLAFLLPELPFPPAFWKHIGEVYPLLWNITKLDVICTLPKNPSPTYLLETEEKYVTLEHLVPLSRILLILRNETVPCLYVCKSPRKEFIYKQIVSCTTDRKIYASDKCSKAVPLAPTLIMRLFVYRPVFTTSQYCGVFFPTYRLF